jgi:hypothetical protein
MENGQPYPTVDQTVYEVGPAPTIEMPKQWPVLLQPGENVAFHIKKAGGFYVSPDQHESGQACELRITVKVENEPGAKKAIEDRFQCPCV